MDYGKYRYEQEQKAKLARKHQSQIHVKEIKLRPKIGDPRLQDQEGPRRALPQPAREGQGHDHVPGAREPPPGAGARPADAARRGREGDRADRVPPLLDGRNMVMVLGPTKNAGVKTTMPKQKTQSGGEEAVQGDGDGEAPAPARDAEPQPREEVAEAKARLRQGPGRSLPATCARSSGCWGGVLSMPRVKRSVHATQEAPQGPRAGEGLLGPQALELPPREGAGRALARLRLPRPQEQEADVPARSGSCASTRPRGRRGSPTTSSSPGCTKAEIELDRKVLADIAVSDPAAFKAVAEQAKAALEAS